MNDPTTRRRFLQGAAGSALGVSTLSGALAACGNTTGPSTSGAGAQLGPGGLPLARQDRPITLPTYGMKPIASGLEPEQGPLRLYMFQNYIDPKVIQSFERTYGVKVEISTFDTTDEALAKLTGTQLGYDLFVVNLYHLEALVAGKLLSPINHDYLPNLRANVWDVLQSPWYDQGSRYTVPYTIYTTGIAWRADKLGPSFDPGRLRNPYDVFWQASAPRGRVSIVDDERDALSMAILRNGGTDVNSEDPKVVNAAGDALAELVGKVNLKILTPYYQRLAEGSIWLSQAWNGDIMAIPSYASKDAREAVRYWWPPSGRGVIQNDTWGLLRGGSSPVLGHLFMNHVLEVEQALANFSFIYFQQPIKQLTNEKLMASGLIAPTVSNALVQEKQFLHGYAQGTLSQAGQVLWQNTWAKVKS